MHSHVGDVFLFSVSYLSHLCWCSSIHKTISLSVHQPREDNENVVDVHNGILFSSREKIIKFSGK